MIQASRYTIGWLCALDTELVAVLQHLDERHDQSDYKPASNDNNTYLFGSIREHNIVIAILPSGEYGVTNAAIVARDMIRSFTNLRIGLMVGIAGGAPLVNEKREHDIRLGDVVISTPSNGRGGVLQYDYGKTIQGQEFKVNGYLSPPPQSILTAVNVLSAEFKCGGNKIHEEITTILERNSRLQKEFQRPDQDRLYQSSFVHENSEEDCSHCCHEKYSIRRAPRNDDIVVVHKGLIASSNQLMKDAFIRDKLAREGVLCFETEAAGVMNQFPFFIVRGICDYADTHKNKEWQGYAAMTAAAYTRRLLLELSPAKVVTESRLGEIEKRFQEMHSDINTIHTNLNRYTARNLEVHFEQWLAAPDPETNFESARDQREPDTGKWFTKFDAYTRWRTGSIRHLWLCGKAGSGKSVISASIIDDVRRYCADKTDIGNAIFYFTFSDSSKQSYIDCLRSIIHQLLKNQSVPSTLARVYESSNGRQGNHSVIKEELQKFLLDEIRRYRKFFLVLDALDESPESDRKNTRQREKLLKWLHTLSVELPSLQILATSRYSPDIQAKLKEMGFHQQPMITDFVNKDIIKFVVSQLNQDRRLRELDADIKEEIQNTFREKAGGMFRWAACQMDDLKNLHSTRPSSIRSVLKSLPTSLDETYDKIIAGIPETEWIDASVLLRWLTYSHRPLTLMELSEARIIRLNTANGSVDDRDRGHYRDVLEMLSPLILVTRPKDKVPIDDNDSCLTVRLAHFSVQEYLETSRQSMERPPPFWFQAEREHHLISRSCMVYLTYCTSAKTFTRTSQDLKTFPLLQYAASFWHTHSRKTDDVEQVIQFLQSDAFLDSQLIHDIHQSWIDPWDAHLGDISQAPLHYAVWAGLVSVVKKLIEYGSDLKTRDYFYGDALQTASYRGHTSIVAMLIKAGADINARNEGYHSNALQAASYEEHGSVVKLLIDSGVNVNALGGHHGTALQAASCRGNESIVRMLIDAGAKLDARGGAHGNALQAASSNGHESIVKVLIKDGVNVDAESGGSYGNALQAASWRGHYLIVKMLVEAGADVNAQAGYYGNALQAASYEGHASIVSLLIEKKANIEEQGGYYGNALQAASAGGHESIVRILIKAGVKVDAQSGGCYGNALQAARRKGCQSIVELLRGAGAYTTTQSGYCNSLNELFAETPAGIIT